MHETSLKSNPNGYNHFSMLIFKKIWILPWWKMQIGIGIVYDDLFEAYLPNKEIEDDHE